MELAQNLRDVLLDLSQLGLICACLKLLEFGHILLVFVRYSKAGIRMLFFNHEVLNVINLDSDNGFIA